MNSQITEIPTNQLLRLLTIVKNRTGYDFSLYKESTVKRRLNRRINFHYLNDLEDYIEYIEKNPDEIDLLLNDLLINVTSFFRDPEAFESFKDKIYLELLDNKKNGDNVNIWVPGCSTGEEPYSITIIIQEYMEKSGKNLNIQIFGTDIDEKALTISRRAKYSDKIIENMSSERLSLFFIKQNDNYRVKKVIRQKVEFKQYDIFSDTPFMQLDIISCRNLLIYLNKDAQKKILSKFINALKLGGILFLGPSESIGKFDDSFLTLDNKNKIFKLKK